MKREYYIDDKKVTKNKFFMRLEISVFNHWRMGENLRSSFEEYYAYIKDKIRNGYYFSYEHTFWSEVINED